ncbi:protein O-mannosyl-transferase 2-like [Oppia nitens]|uniref:protein O-mannosyl-transferase 2-like n=1 Tax=Oppia nitens TaxID=1686743 RepID=UPI0023D9997C|nr:protein O-mannosyl-transferase 2-like [Oppia nitens]
MPTTESKTANRVKNSKTKSQTTSDTKKLSNDDDRRLIDEDIAWYLAFATITVLAFGTRLWKISEPNHVCWDETHFGKMGSWYINHTFFFDVHPPLGKMLIGLAGHLTGYNGTFAFNKPGDKYEDHPYVGMRLFCVTLGTLIIPQCFIIVWQLSRSLTASTMASLFIIFDIGMITLSQYILLDPILIFFIISSVFGSVMFITQNDKPFSKKWWFWLCWTGLFLACSISVKFVGLFVVVLIGLQTIADLWQIYGNLSNPLTLIVKHLLARVLCLIIIPIILYMTFFWIHLKVLYKSGNGDGFFSSAFQSQLEGNSLYNASMPRYIAYGAIVTLKNHRTGGGYLHSHWHLYPEGIGARQQQVTTYSHKDENNKWRINKFDTEVDPDVGDIEFVKNGDLIRLEHLVTTRNLHSHKEPAPVTKKHFQITCYGDNGTGDANDVFRIEIVGGREGQIVETVTSKVKVVHYLMNCALHSHSKQLPKWGYEQMEVSCTPNLLNANIIWNFEDNHFPRLPNVSFEVYAPSFWERFVESHAVMFQGNAGLKPKEGEVTSRPWQWPINLKGQFFSGNEYRIYLLGNPIIWWSNFLLLFVYSVVQFTVCVRRQRGCHEADDIAKQNTRLTNASVWLFIGWALHYIPFYSMGRVLYFHHYFPAALFSSMLSAVIVDYLFTVLPQLMIPSSLSSSHSLLAASVHHWLHGLLVSTIVYSFYLFYPLSYGMSGTHSHETNSTMYGLKWLDSWEF